MPDTKEKQYAVSAETETADNSGKRKSLGEFVRYKRFKWYHIAAAVVVLFVSVLFIGWFVKPSRVLNVAVLDKTVLSYADDDEIVKDTVYRKHRGFFYLLNQQKYVKSDGTDYDYTKDYYGPILNEDGEFDHSVELKNIKTKPDLVYLADAYGLGNDSFGYYNGGSPKNAGISSDDMSVVSYAYESGAPIIGETTLFSSPLSDSVYSQLCALFGIKPKKWIGRYITDLQDFTDIPDWARPMYEQQEGVEWRFTGPGILLVSSDGKIIILEQNTDFNSKDLMTVYINEKYSGEFSGISKCNFYNWFELIDTNYSTESIATFDFDLNETGMRKIKQISKSPRFCAIARKKEKGHAPVYYFAGDFNDYVSGDRFGNFMFSNQVYKFFSFDRQGDISNFYWNFYNPLIRKILDDTKSSEYSDNTEAHKEVSRVNNGTFQVLENKKWKALNLKAISINAQEPGDKKYSRDFTFYEELINKAADLNVNCVVAKDLLPPEFYTAVSRYNKDKKHTPLYIMQRITSPENLNASDYLSENGLKSWKNTIGTVINALHGRASAKGEKLGEASYFTDVSSYVLAVAVDPNLNAENCAEFAGIANYSYSGTYSETNSGINGFASYLYDTLETVSKKNYGYFTPASVSSELGMLSGMSFSKSTDSYLFTDIEKTDCEPYYFNDVKYDSSVLNAMKNMQTGDYEKLQVVIEEVSSSLSSVVLSGISFSNVNEVYNQKAVTESEQGRKITEALGAVRDSDFLGAAVYDLNDCWDSVSDEMKRYTSDNDNNFMWQNVCDEAQMSGVVAMESKQPKETGLVLTDDDLIQAISLSSDAGHMYITLQMFDELNYKTEAMFVGLDTFQRNDGEYYYAKGFTPNSLSGMEFVLRFDGKQEASLYVTNSYDRSKGSAYTKESYNAKYSKVSDLSYGGFTNSDTQFYQTGSTIYVRLPWNWLNVADPSKKLVINDTEKNSESMKTASTNGVLASVMIGERKTGDLLYGFPEDKHSPGYKVFNWRTWEEVDYELREKDSFIILKNYYTDN
ncbi:MAG: hypothetical protein K6F88_01710 [Ruminococcus sp.]|nr:hypothetical protein [Ruminococcus sp.]